MQKNYILIALGRHSILRGFPSLIDELVVVPINLFSCVCGTKMGVFSEEGQGLNIECIETKSPTANAVGQSSDSMYIG